MYHIYIHSAEDLPKGDWACPVCVSGSDTIVPYSENPDEVCHLSTVPCLVFKFNHL